MKQVSESVKAVRWYWRTNQIINQNANVVSKHKLVMSRLVMSKLDMSKLNMSRLDMIRLVMNKFRWKILPSFRKIYLAVNQWAVVSAHNLMQFFREYL